MWSFLYLRLYNIHQKSFSTSPSYLKLEFFHSLNKANRIPSRHHQFIRFWERSMTKTEIAHIPVENIINLQCSIKRKTVTGNAIVMLERCLFHFEPYRSVCCSIIKVVIVLSSSPPWKLQKVYLKSPTF